MYTYRTTLLFERQSHDSQTDCSLAKSNWKLTFIDVQNRNNRRKNTEIATTKNTEMKAENHSKSTRSDSIKMKEIRKKTPAFCFFAWLSQCF